MTYYCKDCSYRGKTIGQGGECPACGSFNLLRGRTQEEEPPRGKLGLILLAAVWTLLIGLIIWKLST